MGTIYPDYVTYDRVKLIADVNALRYEKMLWASMEPYPMPFDDPIGPVKLDVPFYSVARYLERLPEVDQRLTGIESYLQNEAATGKSFIPATIRPNVGDELINEVRDQLKLFSGRLEKIEHDLGAK